jgi:ribosomal protein L29
MHNLLNANDKHVIILSNKKNIAKIYTTVREGEAAGIVPDC